jgi:hypothetical protein
VHLNKTLPSPAAGTLSLYAGHNYTSDNPSVSYVTLYGISSSTFATYYYNRNNGCLYLWINVNGTEVYNQAQGSLGGTNHWYKLSLSVDSSGVTAVASNADGSSSVTTTYSTSSFSKAGSFVLGSGSSYNCAVDDIAWVAAPSFFPAGPQISGSTAVTMTSAGETAIYYTLDGTTPTTNSIPYTVPVTVNQGTTLKAVSVLNGKISPVTIVFYTGPLAVIDNKSWTFNDITVNNGGSASWTSSTAINPGGTHYDYSYTITKVNAKILGIFTNVTSYIPSSNLTNSGSVDGTPPFDLRSANDPVSGTFTIMGMTISISATVHVYVDANGYLHVDISNVNLGSVPAAQVSGTVRATASKGTISNSPVLVVQPGRYEVSADSGTSAFNVNNSNSNTTMNWAAEVISGSDWVSINSGSSGTNSGTISISYLKNSSPTKTRSATIRITAAGVTGSPRDVAIVQGVADLISGDANKDGVVDVGDLGILAANYGMTSGATWVMGDFNNDGVVDVGDLGILAANYGTGSASAVDFNADYAKVFTTTSESNEDADSNSANETEDTINSVCSGLGLTLVMGLALMGLMLVELKE